MNAAVPVTGFPDFDNAQFTPVPDVSWLYRPDDAPGAFAIRSSSETRVSVRSSVNFVLFFCRRMEPRTRYDVMKVAGETYLDPVRRGAFTIIPSNADSQWIRRGRIELLHVHIPGSFLERLFPDESLPGTLFTPRLWQVDPRVGLLLDQLGESFEAPSGLTAVFARSVLMQVCITLVRDHSVRASRVERSGGLSPQRLRRVVAFARENIGRDISLPDLAEVACLSPAYFSRAFKASTGVSPHRWLMERRVDAAKDLLTEGRLSILDIAHACGFASQSHMTDVFRKLSQAPPGHWQRR